MDLIEFFFASGIVGLLLRMSNDIHTIKGAFQMIEEALEEFKRKLEQHEERISNLENERKRGT